jgi:hypothetical protein
MQRELEQHPTPPEIAAHMVELAVRLFGGETALWLEPCCGAGAVLHRLPQPRAGIEIDGALAAACGEGVLRADCLSVTALAEPRERVCVVTNPPFCGGRVGHDGVAGNRRDGNAHWLRRFLTHMGVLATRGVFLLPASVLSKRWWRQTLALDAALLIETQRLGAVHFAGTGRYGIDVVLVALRLPHAWASPSASRRELARTEAAFADEMTIVPAGDGRANCVVTLWGTPERIGAYSFDAGVVERRRAAVCAMHTQNGRARGAYVFLWAKKTHEAAVRLERARVVLAQEYAQAQTRSVTCALGAWIERL